MLTIKEIINNNALKYADKTAFIFAGRGYTFKEIHQRVNSLVNALRSMGFKKGDHIGILGYNSSQYFEVFACSKAGYVIVPLNYRSVGTELEYLINNSEITALILEKEFIELVESIKSKIDRVNKYICLDAEIDGMDYYERLIENYPPDEPDIEIQPDDNAAIYYSSGTTGRPKGAVHTHRSLVAEMLLPTQTTVLGMRSDDIALCVMPFFHVGGSAAHMFCVFASGATAVVLRKFDENTVLRTIQEEKITYVCLVPAMVIRLMDYPDLDKFNLVTLKTMHYTGAYMPIEAVKKAIRRFGPILVQSLGQTETLKMSILPKSDYKVEGSPEELRRLESSGKTIHSDELKILDKNGNEAKPGTPGEIAAHSDRMMSGYWNMPKETAETMKDGWLLTGDMGFMDTEGYVYLVDRKKDMIISGGENIYSREVEDALYTHPAVADAAVIGVPDEKWGECVKALLVLKEGMKATEQEIIDFCKSCLASYKKPKSVEFLESVPKTATGKIRKNELREKYWSGYNKKIN